MCLYVCFTNCREYLAVYLHIWFKFNIVLYVYYTFTTCVLFVYHSFCIFNIVLKNFLKVNVIMTMYYARHKNNIVFIGQGPRIIVNINLCPSKGTVEKIVVENVYCYCIVVME